MRLIYLFFSFIVLVAITPVNARADKLLECQKHYQAKRLTSGHGGTALECYQEVLTIDPSNAKALAGIKKIEASYVKWAKRALNRGQEGKAKRYLKSLRLVNPESPDLAELERLVYPERSIPTPAPAQETASLPSEPTPQAQAPEETPSLPSEPTPQAQAPEETPSQPTDSTPQAQAPEDIASLPSEPTPQAQAPEDIASLPSEPTPQTQAQEETPSQPSEPTPQADAPVQEAPREPAPPKQVLIVELGQIYEAINTTDCLTWPNPEVKEKGGKNGWDSFYPKGGDTGTVVKEMKHCHLDDNVYLLQIGQYYVPISSVGIQIIE